MTSFLATKYYSPILVMLVGLTTFLGLLGLGTATLRLLRVRLPSPWQEVTGVLLGIQVLSLSVQLLGMAGMASLRVLVLTWVVLVAFGGVVTVLWLRNRIPIRIKPDRGLELLFLVVFLAAVAANLLVAIAPSTKIDELYYQMLVPSRIVADGALHFYQQPWEAAILPQMVFQIAMTPLHALNFPDAANVVSWALGLTLFWFAWYLITDSKKSTGWACLWITTLVVGMYSVVCLVTGGSHAMGDLSLAAALVAFVKREVLIEQTGSKAFAGMFSILLLSAASSKVSLLPLAAAMLLLMGFLLLRSVRRQEASRVALALAISWGLFALPIMIWTFSKSGSPFGPVLSGVFSDSVYDTGLMKQTFEYSRQLNRPPLLSVIAKAVLNHPPLFWLGMFGGFVMNAVPRATRLAMALLVAFQSVLIYIFLPYDLRFLAGLPFGLIVCFALSPPGKIQQLLSSKRALAISLAVLLVPWLGVQLYYAQQFFPVALGLQPKSEFYKRYVAFYSDYEKLDQILPKDSVLLTNVRLSAVYSPRPIYFDTADLPRDKEVFFFGCHTEEKESDSVSPGYWPGYRIGERVYENPYAIATTYRTPRRPVTIAPICVGKLIRKGT